MEVLGSRTLVAHADFPAALDWYDRVLGLERSREFGAGGRVTGVVYFLGGGFLELSGSGGPPSAVRLWLQVRDVDAEVGRLAGLGADVVASTETKPWGLREAWVADPEGLRLCLVEVPPDHPLRRRLEHRWVA